MPRDIVAFGDTTPGITLFLNTTVPCSSLYHMSKRNAKPLVSVKRSKSAKRTRNLDDWILLSKSTGGSKPDKNSQTTKGKEKAPQNERVYIDLSLDDSDDEITLIPPSRPSSSGAATTAESTPPPLLSILRDNALSARKAQRFAPLRLPTPALVSQHTPLTIHSSILPMELSCRLYHAMIKASESWSRNKWWLADRLVESPHTTSFYARHGGEGDYDWDEAAQYWYVWIAFYSFT